MKTYSRLLLSFVFLLPLLQFPAASQSAPTIAWYFDAEDYVECSPAIADIDKDSPGSEVLFGYWRNLHCLSSSGDVLWSYYEPKQLFQHPAVADLDRDGNAEAVFHSLGWREPGKIWCFQSDGSLKWSFDTFNGGYNQGVTIANINGDWDAEILAGSTNDTLYCVDASGSLVWKHGAVGDVCIPAVADINEDGYPETIYATTGGYIGCLDSEGNLIWETEIEGMRLVGVAISDVDGDLDAEIIVNGYTVRGKNMLYCLEKDGTVKWTKELIGRLGSIISTAAIDDINNDGKQEIATFSNSYLEEKDSLWVFQDDGSEAKVIWQAPAADWWGGSGSGPVVCDLDGDSFKELILMGSEYLGIYDGRDGNLLYKNLDLRSITRDEHPAVADVDHDGHAEIIATYRYRGLAMLEDDENWTECRNQFSSHYYHITNVRDNLTVPPLEPYFWKGHNSWLAQGDYSQCGPACIKEKVIAELDELTPQSEDMEKRIKKAKKHLEKSLDPRLWLGQTHLVPDRGKKVFYEEKKALKEIEKLCQGEKCKGVTSLSLIFHGLSEALIEAISKGRTCFGPELVSPEDTFQIAAVDEKLGANTEIWVDGSLDEEIDTSCSKPLEEGMVFGDFEVESVDKIGDGGGGFPSGLCERLMGMLVEADSILARVAIDDAIAANGNPKEIEKAKKEMASAEKEKEKGKYDKAIDHYKKAWEHAMKAVKPRKGNQMSCQTEIESSTVLLQNKPNPATSSTRIDFVLEHATPVKLSVYDIAGRLIWRVKVSHLSKGLHSLGWNCMDKDGMPVPSGIYIYRLETNTFSHAKKMAVVR